MSTSERDGEWLRPLPRPDNVTAPYWEAAARGELLIQRCPACGHRQFYPRALCTVCGADPEWERASGQGTVHTFTVIRQNYAKPFRDEMPYVVALLDLDESGARQMTNIVEAPVDSVTIGARVRLRINPITDAAALPFFVLHE